MTEVPQMDLGLVIPMFSQGDDPIACLNKAMAFLTTVSSSRKGQSYSGTGYKGNDTSSRGNNTSGQARVVKCYNCQGEGHMARQCTQPKRPRNAAWFKEKAMLAEAQEAGQILDEEQLAFLAGPSIPGGQAAQTTISNNAAFQTKDLDAYDSDCDNFSNAKAVLMANLSNYGSDVISEEKANQEKNNESVTAELERYKERVKTFKQRLNIYLSSYEKMIDSQMNDTIKEKLALKKKIDLLEQNLSNQIKEKESLLQTFTVFKNESREKESKYIDKECDLEKKIKELDNIVYKVGQSAQTVHIVISSQHFAMPVIDDDETLILEEILVNVLFHNKNYPMNKLFGYKLHTLILTNLLRHLPKLRHLGNFLRLTKFEADFKQQQSEMTNKIDTVLKAIVDRIAGALPSDMPNVPMRSISAVTIHPKQKSKSLDDKPEENREEEKNNLENIHANPFTPPDPSIPFITKIVLKLNSFFESLGLVPQSSNTKLVCTKGDDDDVMYIEIVKTDDDSHKEEPKAGEQEVEYFDIILTRIKLAYYKYLMCGPIPSIFLWNPIIMEGCLSNLKIP
ncbi:retrovirus-related pol polyprotein from transposon TNT 1-94 [Tanacetum coccineum]